MNVSRSTNLPIVQFLIKKKANLNEIDNKKSKSLMLACENG